MAGPLAGQAGMIRAADGSAEAGPCGYVVGTEPGGNAFLAGSGLAGVAQAAG